MLATFRPAHCKKHGLQFRVLLFLPVSGIRAALVLLLGSSIKKEKVSIKNQRRLYMEKRYCLFIALMCCCFSVILFPTLGWGRGGVDPCLGVPPRVWTPTLFGRKKTWYTLGRPTLPIPGPCLRHLIGKIHTHEGCHQGFGPRPFFRREKTKQPCVGQHPLFQAPSCLRQKGKIHFLVLRNFKVF